MNKVNRMISKYNFNSGSVSRIKYIVIHYVGALGGAKENCAYYGGGNRGASAHYFVGFAGEIWQCVEDKNIAWHCGASSYRHPECRNANSIGIEMCVRKKSTETMNATDKDWYFEKATVQSAVELTKYLMKKYNVPAERVIRHYDVTGKICQIRMYTIQVHTPGMRSKKPFPARIRSHRPPAHRPVHFPDYPKSRQQKNCWKSVHRSPKRTVCSHR